MYTVQGQQITERFCRTSNSVWTGDQGATIRRGVGPVPPGYCWLLQSGGTQFFDYDSSLCPTGLYGKTGNTDGVEDSTSTIISIDCDDTCNDYPEGYLLEFTWEYTSGCFPPGSPYCGLPYPIQSFKGKYRGVLCCSGTQTTPPYPSWSDWDLLNYGGTLDMVESIYGPPYIYQLRVGLVKTLCGDYKFTINEGNTAYPQIGCGGGGYTSCGLDADRIEWCGMTAGNNPSGAAPFGCQAYSFSTFEGGYWWMNCVTDIKVTKVSCANDGSASMSMAMSIAPMQAMATLPEDKPCGCSRKERLAQMAKE